MKARIIHTKFYESERVLNLSSHSRWLFMYYLTCAGIGLTGAFKWSDSKTIFETGLTVKDLEKAKSELTEARLVAFHDSWVVVPETQTKTGYASGEGITAQAYKREIESLPEEVRNSLLLLDKAFEQVPNPLEGVSGGRHTPINHKSEIRNNSSLVLSSYEAALTEMKADPEYLDSLATKYQVPPSFVLSKLDDLENWVREKPSRATGRNLKRTLAGWVKKDALTLKERSQNGRPNLTVLPGAS